MSFKDQLEATVQKGRDCNVITADVKKTLLEAAQNGESSVFLPLNDEYGYKVGVIRQFLENEDIKFKMIYDAKLQFIVRPRGEITPFFCFYI